MALIYVEPFGDTDELPLASGETDFCLLPRRFGKALVKGPVVARQGFGDRSVDPSSPS